MNLWKTELLTLLVGDVVVLVVSLYVTLLIRYQELPSSTLFQLHLIPFSFLFALSLLIFFIIGAYDRQTLITRSELPARIITAQSLNVLFAAVLFFFLPIFSIAPKTNLVIYLLLSSLFVVLWRMLISPKLMRARKKETALIITSSNEATELIEEINANDRYPFTCLSPVAVEKSTSLAEQVSQRLASDAPSIIIADADDPSLRSLLPNLFNYIFAHPNTVFISFNDLYESIFERIALSSVSPEWFLKYAAHNPHGFYRLAKRGIDIAGALILGIFFVALYPLLYVLMRISDQGPFFITQERMGRYAKKIYIHKIRTMTSSDNGAWRGESHNRVTALGSVLRRTSIDELPQVFSILKGSLSLIGPRSDMYALAERLAEHIPYYLARYSITPGISGWAQTHQRYAPGNISPQSIEESHTRLAYDLYYVKHRSLLLDISIALRTIKTLLQRVFPL